MRAVQLDSFGGPELLAVREIPAPQAGPGQIRVRVAAAGLNPMDWIITADADTAARFGLSLPVGFGTDYAGVIDQVGDGVSGFAVDDRVFGGALSRAVADFVLINVTGGSRPRRRITFPTVSTTAPPQPWRSPVVPRRRPWPW